jgi:MinD superfamily P-loop ATPase
VKLKKMVISVASGKGGTGKTTVAVSLAVAAGDLQLLDCDVEEPNAHIFIKPEQKKREPVYTMVPEVDEEKCTLCGRCREVCAYNAIAVLGKTVLVFPELCHGCGSCSYFCPESAIREIKKEIGFVESGIRDRIEFVRGNLKVGEAISPPLIKAAKKHIKPGATVIIDAPPGTSCPVIESIKGSDFCVLVTEPTPFGLHDLCLAVEVMRKLGIPFGAVINRCDIGNNLTTDYCKKENIPILLELPFKREIAEVYSKGIPLVDALPEYRSKFLKLLERIERLQ